ncbi:MAG TPA: hypothetical protein VMT57_02025 [Candidatus Thermoplasmatota archaeon]|nr:hypothetical protein [Candidatus Thermoplasmatota archaeon]
MSNKEKIVEVLHLVEGKKENFEVVLEALDKFFQNLRVEVEDWKISMEEFEEGTRIFVRFQVIVKR